jgi:hypothetical protein
METITFAQFMIVLAVYSLGVGVAFIYDAATRNKVTNMIFASWLYLILVFVKSLFIKN